MKRLENYIEYVYFNQLEDNLVYRVLFLNFVN